MSSLPEKLFFLGLGGMGMAPLSLFLADRGYQVEGWDDHFRVDVMELLRESSVGIRNHPSEDVGMLVISSAIHAEHPLRTWAKERGIPVLHRGEVLARATTNDRLVAIVGSHGKTTTTAMLIHLLRATGVSFDYVLGGLFAGKQLLPAKGNSKAIDGERKWVVAEVDESDGTIDHFQPEITLAVDWDWDHPDRYNTSHSFEDTLFALFQRTRREIWLPHEKQVDVSRFTATCGVWNEQDLRLPVDFPLRGQCNLRNAAAARSIARSLAGEWNDAWWYGFPGIVRRQQWLGETRYWQVFQDYAHHPAELKGLFEAIRSGTKENQPEPLILFQPHRYSRTRQFAREFAEVLRSWREVALIPVYSAGESLAMGADADCILKHLEPSEGVTLLTDDRGLEEFMKSRTGTDGKRAVWFVGAGDIESMAYRWMRGARSAEQWPSSESLWEGCPSVSETEPLGAKTTLRVGGRARYYAEPTNRQEVVQLWERARQLEIPVYPMGRGSNLLIMDEGVNGLVLRLRRGDWESIELLPDGGIRVGAGVSLKLLCGRASTMGWTGFEFLEGIPGSVGGALRMNAGAMGGWMMDVVSEVEVLTAEGIRHYQRDQLHAYYRYCQEVAEGIALSAVIRPVGSEETQQIRARIHGYSERRKESQPREASAGCIFKNPQGNHAGKLIDLAGLKGLRIGDAEISTVHGNFIINRKQATSEEVIALVRFARHRLQVQAGYVLEPEVLIWGAQWQEVLA